MTDKVAKDEVKYSRGHMQEHCGPTFHDDKYYCRHFIPGPGYTGNCELVRGAIDPIYWCELFKRMKKT